MAAKDDIVNLAKTIKTRIEYEDELSKDLLKSATEIEYNGGDVPEDVYQSLDRCVGRYQAFHFVSMQLEKTVNEHYGS